jgi:hypothetical protein
MHLSGTRLPWQAPALRSALALSTTNPDTHCTHMQRDAGPSAERWTLLPESVRDSALDLPQT